MATDVKFQREAATGSALAGQPVTGTAGPLDRGGAGYPPGSMQIQQRPLSDFGQTVALLVAVATMGLGLALGVANQVATGTPMAIRIPALLASLLMVGQGVLDVVRFRPGRERVYLSSGSISPSMPVLLVVLGAWLGWANLQVTAPSPLQQLSLISSFVLFALGWSLIRRP